VLDGGAVAASSAPMSLAPNLDAIAKRARAIGMKV